MLNYEYPPLGGGAAPVCRQLCELYAARGHEVQVITMGFRGLPAWEVLNGVDVTRVPALRKVQATCETHEMFSYVISALPRVIWRLWRNDFAAIHLHFVIPTGLLAYLATRLKRVPYIITAHGSDIPGYNPDRFKKEHHLTTPLLRRIMDRAYALTAPSLFLKGLMLSTCGAYEIAHIPNGIFVGRFQPQAKQKRILMTGRLLPRKGFHTVLLALQGMDACFEVHIAGDGPDRERMEATARTLSMPVRFHGWLEHGDPRLQELYESSMIFCLPSSRENASISLLEAMLAGMAVVTSNVTGCPETVGDTGRVVSPDDVEGLRTVLSELMGSPEKCEAMGQRARARVLDEFDWEKIADGYLNLISDAAKSAKRNTETTNTP